MSASAGRMRLYNTLTRQADVFTPLRDNTVRMYACGLTVYARGHVGNFRTFACLDILRRTLRYAAGFKLHQAINFTDVDDKTIRASREAGVPLREYTDRFIPGTRLHERLFHSDAACTKLAVIYCAGNRLPTSLWSSIAAHSKGKGLEIDRVLGRCS